MGFPVSGVQPDFFPRTKTKMHTWLAYLTFLRQSGKSPKEKGDAFEVFCRHWLNAQPWVLEAKLYKDVDPRIKDEWNLTRPDKGTDILVTLKKSHWRMVGEKPCAYLAVQCKFRSDPDEMLNLEVLGNFEGDASQVSGGLLMTTLDHPTQAYVGRRNTNCAILEWASRTSEVTGEPFKNTMPLYALPPKITVPRWFQDPDLSQRVAASHRAMLRWKAPDFAPYESFGPVAEEPEYVWPAGPGPRTPLKKRGKR